MAWPVCPECGAMDVRRMDTRAEVVPVEILVFRSYRCPCGWVAWTVEQVYCTDPETVYLKSKFDHSHGQTPSTSGDERPQAEGMEECRRAKKV